MSPEAKKHPFFKITYSIYDGFPHFLLVALCFVFTVEATGSSLNTHPFVVLNEDLHHNVLELDVHDCSHGLLLWAEQGGAEHDAQIGHRHQVLLVVTRHTAQRPLLL